MARGTFTPQRLLAFAIVAVIVLATLPGRFTRWVEWFRGPVQFVLTPASGAASALAHALRPAVSATAPADPATRQVAEDRDHYRTLWLDAERRNDELQRQLAELQRGAALMPEIEVAHFYARVTGVSSDPRTGPLEVRAGRDRGVTEGDTVAVVNAVHLVGRVIDVRPRTSSVLPITRPGAGWIQARIMIDDATGASWPCQLRGAGDGTLRGDVEERSAGAEADQSRAIEPGQTVRLQDPNWPETAQMLVIGRVERVAPKENAPLRLEVVVRPDVQLDLVPSVILRAPAPQGESEPEGEAP